MEQKKRWGIWAELGFLVRGLHCGVILIYLEELPLGEKFEDNVGKAVFLAGGLYQKDERA